LGFASPKLAFFPSGAWNLPSGESDEIVLAKPLQNQEYG
jgi:hypothetical protein